MELLDKLERTFVSMYQQYVKLKDKFNVLNQRIVNLNKDVIPHPITTTPYSDPQDEVPSLDLNGKIKIYSENLPGLQMACSLLQEATNTQCNLIKELENENSSKAKRINNLEGIPNFGNTCYINAVLQVLIKQRYTADWLRSMCPDQHNCMAASVPCKLRKLESASDIGCKQRIIEYLRDIPKEEKTGVPLIPAYQQLDAYDFLQSVFDMIGATTNPFDIVITKFLECLTLDCGYTSENVENAQAIELDIRGNGNVATPVVIGVRSHCK